MGEVVVADNTVIGDRVVPAQRLEQSVEGCESGVERRLRIQSMAQFRPEPVLKLTGFCASLGFHLLSRGP
jgi:hypothetical protein